MNQVVNWENPQDILDYIVNQLGVNVAQEVRVKLLGSPDTLIKVGDVLKRLSRNINFELSMRKASIVLDSNNPDLLEASKHVFQAYKSAATKTPGVLGVLEKVAGWIVKKGLPEKTASQPELAKPTLYVSAVTDLEAALKNLDVVGATIALESALVQEEWQEDSRLYALQMRLTKLQAFEQLAQQIDELLATQNPTLTEKLNLSSKLIQADNLWKGHPKLKEWQTIVMKRQTSQH